MTVVDDTTAALKGHNASLGQVEARKDELTLALAGQLDTERQNSIIWHEKADRVQNEYDHHMLTVHPVAPKRRTLHGLGGGNSVRTGIELDRRYYAPGDKDKTVRDTTANETKGIVSWNSHKMPYTWDRMAKGDGDQWFKELMTALREAVKPKIDDPDDVDEAWESVHHEPEGDQPDERLWRDTQERLSLLVPDDGVFKFWLSTTGWNQEYNTANVAQMVDWGNLYPKNGNIFGISYDAPYNTYGKLYNNGVPTGEFNKKVTDPYAYVDAVARRAKEFGVEAALGEWGESDEMFALDPTWSVKVRERTIVNPYQQLLGEAYFDTKLYNSYTWWLGAPDSPKRKAHMANIAKIKGR